MVIRLETLQTTYYNGTGRTTQNTRNGTLGAHEDEHKTFAQLWWTTDHLRQIAGQQAMSFSSSDNDAQAKAIFDYLRALHAAQQQQVVDGLNVALPTFGGHTWYH
jgi:hypothetical protein